MLVQKKKNNYKIKIKYLSVLKVKNVVAKIWKEAQNQSSNFLTYMHKFTRWYKNYGKKNQK